MSEDFDDVEETPEFVDEQADEPADSEDPPKKPKPKPKPKKKPMPKKAAAKKAPKKVAKKAPKAKSSEPRAKKEGLRMFQVRTLQVLSKSAKDLSQSDIAKKAGISVGFINKAIGPAEPDAREEKDKEFGFDSLLTLKYVKIASKDGRAYSYSITPAGKSAIEKYLASNKVRTKNKNGR